MGSVDALRDAESGSGAQGGANPHISGNRGAGLVGVEVGGGWANIIGAACPHGVRTWSGQPADMVSDLRAGRPAKRYAYRVRRQVTEADNHQGR